MQLNKNLFISFLVILSIMCTSRAFATENPSVVKNENNSAYTEDNVNIVVTKKNPTFVIKLKSNPSTGYSWFLREYDNNLIVPVKHNYLPPEKVMPGAAGSEEWTFRAKPNAFTVPQQSTVRMIYARPWQGSDSATQVVFRLSTTSE